MSSAKKKAAEKKFSSLNEEFKPKTKNQSEYLRTLIDNDITFVTGCAGTGKSYLAIGLACQYFLEKRYDKIIIVRPAVEASKKGLGYLPGDLDEKLTPYMLPAVEHMKRFLGLDVYHNAVRDENIRFMSLEYMRGTTINYSFAILEEAQNCTTEQLKMFITRIGTESKMLINGDTDQTDLWKSEDADYSTDLEYVIAKVRKATIPGFGFAELDENDIQRHPLIAPFLRIMK